MFFKLNKEKRIGYKELTDADLGRAEKSHQTHIGLLGDVLAYLPNSFDMPDCMTICDNSIEFLSLSFDRIENPDHTYRSPKIRIGEKDAISVVSFIRDKAKDFEKDTKWFLFWFGLESGQPVFFVFNNKSNTYKDMLKLNINLSDNVKKILTEKDDQFSTILNYLEEVVNKAGIEIAQDLEVVAQTNDTTKQKKYREYDVKKAQEIFSKIGKEGEFLVNQYFLSQKSQGLIANFKWVNEDKESGLPYDFYIESLNGEIIYLDVKTTNYTFSQKMVFSNDEINFATENFNKYSIYRVYINENNERCLKICSDTKNLFIMIREKTLKFENEISPLAIIESIKMAIAPMSENLSFGNQIVLAI